MQLMHDGVMHHNCICHRRLVRGMLEPSGAGGAAAQSMAKDGMMDA
jgi:hypothetical protein